MKVSYIQNRKCICRNYSNMKIVITLEDNNFEYPKYNVDAFSNFHNEDTNTQIYSCTSIH